MAEYLAVYHDLLFEKILWVFPFIACKVYFVGGGALALFFHLEGGFGAQARLGHALRR